MSSPKTLTLPSSQENLPKRIRISMESANFGVFKSNCACLSCRARKKKCDGRLPSCGRCVRLNATCKYPSSEGKEKVVEISSRDSSVIRVLGTESTTLDHINGITQSNVAARAATSCVRCNKHHAACDRKLPVCTRCANSKRSSALCQYRPTTVHQGGLRRVLSKSRDNKNQVIFRSTDAIKFNVTSEPKKETDVNSNGNSTTTSSGPSATESAPPLPASELAASMEMKILSGSRCSSCGRDCPASFNHCPNCGSAPVLDQESGNFGVRVDLPSIMASYFQVHPSQLFHVFAAFSNMGIPAADPGENDMFIIVRFPAKVDLEKTRPIQLMSQLVITSAGSGVLKLSGRDSLPPNLHFVEFVDISTLAASVPTHVFADMVKIKYGHAITSKQSTKVFPATIPIRNVADDMVYFLIGTDTVVYAPDGRPLFQCMSFNSHFGVQIGTDMGPPKPLPRPLLSLVTNGYEGVEGTPLVSDFINTHPSLNSVIPDLPAAINAANTSNAANTTQNGSEQVTKLETDPANENEDFQHGVSFGTSPAPHFALTESDQDLLLFPSEQPEADAPEQPQHTHISFRDDSSSTMFRGSSDSLQQFTFDSQVFVEPTRPKKKLSVLNASTDSLRSSTVWTAFDHQQFGSSLFPQSNND